MGILGFVTLGITGSIAWYLGNRDLREMNVGRMDPSGSDLTLYGRIIGIVSVALYALICIVSLFMLVVSGNGTSIQ